MPGRVHADGEASDTVTVRDGPGVPLWRRAHLSVEERVARGRRARERAPRSAHGAWRPGPGRPDPVGLLEEQAASRVAELVPIRYGRMGVSPVQNGRTPPG